MHTNDGLYTSVLGLLKKHGRVSNASVASLLEGISLVQKGLRLAYLVDSLAFNENSASEMQNLMNQESPDATCFVLYEQFTAQAFVVNQSLALLLPSNRKKTIFIDTATGDLANLDTAIELSLCRFIRIISDHAALIQSTSGPLIVNVKDLLLEDACEGIQDHDSFFRSFMIALTGVLLEYPFTYYVPPSLSTQEAIRHLSSQRLVFVELQLLSPSGGDMESIIKFSTPQAYKDRENDTFEQALRASKAVYEARLTGPKGNNHTTERLIWQIRENEKGANVAL